MTEERKFDIVKEVINIGVGDAAAAMSRLTGSRVVIRVPEITVLDVADLPAFIAQEGRDLGVYISQDFRGAVGGRVLLFYTRTCASQLLASLTGQPGNASTLSRTEIATLQEVGNIIAGCCISTIGDMLEDRIDFQMPQVTEEISETYFHNMVDELAGFDRAIVIRNEMTVEVCDISGYIFVLLSFSDFALLMERLEKRAGGRYGAGE